MRRTMKQQCLSLAVMLYLLSNAGMVIAQGPFQATSMVTPENNVSTPGDAYNSIKVSQNSLDSSVLIDGRTVYLGIGNNSTEPMNVYLTAPLSGSYNVIVSNDGSANPGRVMAAGAGSIGSGAVTNIHGPLQLQVTATAAGEGRATADAIGVGATSGTVTVDTVSMAVNAVGGASSDAAQAIVHGLANGNDGADNQPIMTIGTTGGTNSIIVAATGGTAAGNLTNVSAVAYGAESYGDMLFKGATTMSAISQAGSTGSSGVYTAGEAYSTTYGIYNAGPVLTMDDMIFSMVSAAGTAGADTHAEAYGIFNIHESAAIHAGNLTFSNVRALGGNSSNSGDAAARAVAVANQGSGSFTAKDVMAVVKAFGGGGLMGNAAASGFYTEGTADLARMDMNVLASGGSGVQEAKAEAFGIENRGALFTASGDMHKLTVSAMGGKSTSTDGSNDVSATAYGVNTVGAIALSGTTTLNVGAVGGMPLINRNGATYMAGNASALAIGINNGSESATSSFGDLILTEISARGGTGSDVYAEAYGLINAGYRPTINIGSFTAAKISAAGGNASAMGDAGATAGILNNSRDATISSTGTITGAVEAAGGHGPVANKLAFAIENYGTINGTNFDLTSMAVDGWGSDESTAAAQGIVNYGTVTMTKGTNTVNVAAYGGTSLHSALVNAVAQGIYNAGLLELSGPAIFTVQATGGRPSEEVGGSIATDASATAYGLYNEHQEVLAGDLVFRSVVAAGGKGDQAYAEAAGIYNEQAPKTIRADSIAMDLVKAQGGNGTATAYARAFGIRNQGSTLDIMNDSGSNTLTVESKGGTVMGTDNGESIAYGEAYGIANDDGGLITIQGRTQLDVQAVGGTIAAAAEYDDTSATAVGLMNESNQGITLKGPLTIRALATTQTTPGQGNTAYAGGIVSTNGFVQALEEVHITAGATAGDGQKFMAGALYANGGSINLGTDGQVSLGKVIQLEGDILAKGVDSLINVTLDQASSYLQGNVAETEGGVVNLSVSKGATWKPVYDNRYGSFYDEAASATHSKGYAAHANAITGLRLSDGGIVDLAWDDGTRDPVGNQRLLTISQLSGDGGIFKLHSNLGQGIADQLSIGPDSTARQAFIDVTYDPALSSTALTASTSPVGEALVVKASPEAMTFTGKEDSYNLYTYTPQLRNNNDGTWTLTSLKISNVADDNNGNNNGGSTDNTGNRVLTASAPVRDAGNAAMALHDLFINGELNNLQKRLGDLRAAEPASSGIWARYEHNKLERGSRSSLNYNLFQVGYDRDFVNADGVIYRGAAFSYAKGTGDYEIGHGDLREGTLSLYQTGIRRNGNYYDIILKGGRLSNQYDLTQTANASSADYHTWGYSLSGEVGRRIRHTNGFYVEPQAELTLGRIRGADYTTTTGMKVAVEDQNIALARIGIAFGKELDNGNTYYAKASFYHDFGKGVSLTAADRDGNRIDYPVDTVRNWGVLTIGGTVQAGDQCSLYGEVSKYVGPLTNHVQFNGGARWKI